MQILYMHCMEFESNKDVTEKWFKKTFIQTSDMNIFLD